MSQKFWYFLLLTIVLVLTIFSQIVTAKEKQPVCKYNPEAYRNLDINRLSQELKHNGLIGSVHGAIPSSQMFVLSVRKPDNFFHHREFSILVDNAKNLASLEKIQRHDRICVRGHFISNPSPQKHIAVKSIAILDSPNKLSPYPPYERQAKLPDELIDRTNFIGKVHAIAEGGKILVVEYKDGIIPIFVRSTEYTEKLFRGDIIQLTYQIQNYPKKPTHLQLANNVNTPIKIIDSISDLHGTTQTLSGSLVKFPQSPQLQFDVYGIEVDTQGIKRYFTLVNFDDLKEFENIRNKLADIWDSNLETIKSGRNMLINPDVQITANGIINVISPEQANPQILLENAEKIVISH
jgi:hypothetical protein